MKHLLARIFRIAPLAAAWGFCVISLPAAAYDWLQFGGSPAHSGNNVLENKAGQSSFKATRAIGDAHPIEEVGAKLRAMMPWIAKNKLVDTAKN